MFEAKLKDVHDGFGLPFSIRMPKTQEKRRAHNKKGPGPAEDRPCIENVVDVSVAMHRQLLTSYEASHKNKRNKKLGSTQ